MMAARLGMAVVATSAPTFGTGVVVTHGIALHVAVALADFFMPRAPAAGLGLRLGMRTTVAASRAL
jgi:hypothetical protein